MDRIYEINEKFPWLKYFLVSIITLPLLLSKELSTVGSKPHNRLGRIGPFAIVDIIPIVLISYFTGMNFFLLIIVGIITHVIFKIKTPLNTFLNLNF